MTENWPKKRWVVYKCEDCRLIVKNDANDLTAKQILKEDYYPFCIVQVLDYTTGELLEKLKLEDLYS